MLSFFSWKNPGTGLTELVVVVAGGDMLETEILFLNAFNVNATGWMTGPNLPINIIGTNMISYQV